MLLELLGIVAPIYACIGLGWVWARTGRRYDTDFVTELIMVVGGPALVFSSLTDLAVDPAVMLGMAGAALAALALMAIIGAVLLAALRLPRHTYLSPLVFMNTGNIGLPVCLFAFGDVGLSLGVTFFAVCALGQFTVGIAIWSGRMELGELLRTPLAWATVLAVVALACDIPVPEWLQRTTHVLGGFTIPLMQFTLGVSLHRLRVGGIRRTVGLAAVRIGLGLAVGVGLAWLFALDGVVRSVFILDCAMPVAVFNYLLAQRYDRSPADVAGLVVVSTLLSLVTLPMLLGWLL